MAGWSAGVWRGVLLRGPSGAGKSALALRLTEAGWRLVADDRVLCWRSGDRVFGRAPAALAGLVEVRGQGVAAWPALAWCEIALIADLAAPPERAPDPAWEALQGARLPRLVIAPDAPHPATTLAAALSGRFHV